MIASLLGAPIRDEPDPSPQAEDTGEAAAPTADAAPVTPRSRAPRPKPTPAERAPGDWHTLCSELGIEPPPPPPRPAAAPVAPVPPPVETDAADDSDHDVPEWATASARWMDEAREMVDAHEAYGEAAVGPSDADADPEAAAPGDAAEYWEDRLGADHHASSAEPDRQAREGAAPGPDEETEHKRRRRRKRRGTARERQGPAASGPQRSAAGAPSTEDLDEGELSREDNPSRVSDVEQAEGRRPARRERRDSGRARDAQTAPELDFEDDDREVEEDWRYRGRAANDADEGEDASEEDGQAQHKKLPTWEETIGVIIAGNLELRQRESNSRSRPPRGRRRGGRDEDDRR